ncbi:MAG: hypothetical protein EBY17_25230 [Acidobacteriia bacterium]|nr:hypothetical protein [Terriglobia bacterium]
MSEPIPGTITAHLIELGQGTPEALTRLAPLVYDQLHRLATGQMRSERGAHTLQPTALVHEAFLRLQAGIPSDVRSRAQFYALAVGCNPCRNADRRHLSQGTSRFPGSCRRCRIRPGALSGRCDEAGRSPKVPRRSPPCHARRRLPRRTHHRSHQAPRRNSEKSSLN